MVTTTVLLGAGASRDAGVPISAELTAALLSQIDFRSRALLHFVYGGLLMQEAAAAYPGHSRPIAVDAEDLFNAVEALANRATLDAAPFVASWHPLIDRFDDYPEADLEREIGNGLGRLASPQGSGSLARILARAISRRARNNRFQQVGTNMVSTLKNLLAIGDPGRIEYLAPLLELHNAQDGGLVVATLNYDTLIEQLGAVHSVQVDDCLDQWLTSGAIRRSDALTLLKLHGSIDWVQGADGSVHRAAGAGGMQPALIFGGINKLRADGPYLEMLWEWRSYLDMCDHLIIIGYSLRDTHVNAIIERWHKQNNLKRVTIVDPGYDNRASSLAQYLHLFSNEYLGPFETVGNQRRQSNQWLGAPVQIIRAGAKQTLLSLLPKISTWPPTSTDRPPDVVRT
jgi:SIR2-like domain